MITPNASGTAVGAAAKATGGGAAEAARDTAAEDSGFADLLARPAAEPVAKPSNPPGAAEADTDTEDSATADTPPDPTLPEQLLALIAASPATARAAGSKTPASPAAAGASPVQPAMPGAAATTLPATSPAMTTAAAIPSAVTAATATVTAGTETPLAPLPTAGTASAASGDATAALAGTTTPSAAATGTGNADAINLGDFAKALGLAATADAAAAASTASDTAAAPEVADRGSLLAPTTSAATPMRTAAAAAVNPVLTLPADPDAGFDDAFGARIGWLADQRIGRAEIRLNPEHLGAIDVRLQIDGTRVSAEFQSAHADVRQALENSVGRLRELLGQQGLQLAQSDVGHGRGGEHGDRAAAMRGDNSASEHEAGLIERPLPQTLHSRGLLDEYA